MKGFATRRAGQILPVCVILLALPQILSSPYWRGLLIVCAINVLLAMSLNLVLGYTGQLHLGQSGFFALGAYASTILVKTWSWGFWPATWGYFLSQMVGFDGTGLTLAGRDWARHHAVAHLRPGGHLPVLRVGRQPYGILPVTSLDRWTSAEAEGMAKLAAERSLYTGVGLQARSDPALMYARELVQQGFIGEILAVDFSYVSKATTRRGAGRIWQSDRRAGANILTIGGGHAIDALNFVLGDFREVSARVATKTTEWYNTDTEQATPVDSPDWVSVTGRQPSGVTTTVSSMRTPPCSGR